MLEMIQDGVTVRNGHARLLQWNGPAERLLGLDGAKLDDWTTASPEWAVIEPDGTPCSAAAWPALEAPRTGIPVRDVIFGDQPTRCWSDLAADQQHTVRQRFRRRRLRPAGSRLRPPPPRAHHRAVRRRAIRVQMFRALISEGKSIGEIARIRGISRQLASRILHDAKDLD